MKLLLTYKESKLDTFIWVEFLTKEVLFEVNRGITRSYFDLDSTMKSDISSGVLIRMKRTNEIN